MNGYRVKVEKDVVDEKSGDGVKGPWRIRSQAAWIFLYDENGQEKPHPTEISLQLQNGNGTKKDQEPYSIGEYLMPLSCLQAAKFGKLEVRVKIISKLGAKKS